MTAEGFKAGNDDDPEAIPAVMTVGPETGSTPAIWIGNFCNFADM